MTLDRRTERTLQAIRQAFVALLAERRYEAIGVADIAERANIGKSTFYDHYRGKDAMLFAMVDPMLGEIAGCVLPEPRRAALTGLLRHFWDGRRLGRVVFVGRFEPVIRRRLAELAEQRLASPNGALLALQFAGSATALLGAWLAGEVASDPETIAERLLAAGRLAAA